jgi:hypothetical protein
LHILFIFVRPVGAAWADLENRAEVAGAEFDWNVFALIHGGILVVNEMDYQSYSFIFFFELDSAPLARMSI